MLCDICKVKQATIFYTEIKDGQKKEQHLCEECAASHTTLKLVNPLTNQPVTLGGLLSGILENYAKALSGGEKPEKKLVCKSCGMSYNEFLKLGRFGCTECYNNFGGLVEKTLSSIHGAKRHTGSRPAWKTDVSEPVDPPQKTASAKKAIAGKPLVKEKKKVPVQPQDMTVTQLKLEMQAAVRVEDYERAAMLRDILHAKQASPQKAGEPS